MSKKKPIFLIASMNMVKIMTNVCICQKGLHSLAYIHDEIQMDHFHLTLHSRPSLYTPLYIMKVR